ncbi:MAG: hypothetical protein PHO41_05730 [Eubacteriales bacterium]|nr:hypothetical protein [Eubacteriales bacterium]
MIVSGLLTAAAALYCGLYGAYCLQKKKIHACIGAWLLTAVTAGACVWVFLP